MNLESKPIVNIVGKGENCVCNIFSFSQNVFYPFRENFNEWRLPVYKIIDTLLSGKAFNFDKSYILLSAGRVYKFLTLHQTLTPQRKMAFGNNVKKEELLFIKIFSFSQKDFYTVVDKFNFMVNVMSSISFVVCYCFQFGQGLNFVMR